MAKTKTYNVLVDTMTSTQNNAFTVNTNDLKTVKLNLLINQDNEPLDLTDATVRLAVKKPDQKTVLQDATIIDALAGSCEIVLDTQAYVIPGNYTAEVMVFYGTDTVAVTSNFAYKANRGIMNDDSVESTNEWQSITQAIADAESIKTDAQASATSSAESASLAESLINGAKGNYPSLSDRLVANETSLAQIVTNISGFPKQTGEPDDTARIQRAIDQATANKKRVAITGNVTVGQLNVTCDIIGLPGHQITLLSGARLAVQSDAVIFENLNIISQSNKVFRAAYLAKYKNVVIKNCNVNFTTTDTGVLFLELLATEKVTVKDNIFNVGGVQITSADEVLVQGNIIDAQFKNDNEPIQVSTRSVARIIDNTIYNSQSDMIDLYSSGYETIVRGNKGIGFKFSTFGASCMECKVIVRNPGDPNPGSNEAGFVRNTIISDNIMRDIVIPASYTNSTFMGIYAQYLDQRTPGPAVWDATQTNEGMIIKNNIIENVTFEAGATGNTFAGIDFAGINGLIDGNIIKDVLMQTNAFGTCGINLGSTYAKAIGVTVVNNTLIVESVGINIVDAESSNISNNTIRKNDRNTIEPRYGIRVTKSLLESNVNNNVIRSKDFPIDTISTATIQRCNFNNNQIKATNSTTGTITLSCDFQFNNFNNNIVRNSLALAQPSALKFGNTFKDNKFFLDTAGNGIFLDYQNGFTVSGNTFDNGTNGIRLLTNCQNGIVKDNISRQSQAAVVNNAASVNIILLDNIKI